MTGLRGTTITRVTLATLALAVAAPAGAQASSLLSGYGGPGTGSQAILGAALIGGGPSGGGSLRWRLRGWGRRRHELDTRPARGRLIERRRCRSLRRALGRLAHALPPGRRGHPRGCVTRRAARLHRGTSCGVHRIKGGGTRVGGIGHGPCVRLRGGSPAGRLSPCSRGVLLTSQARARAKGTGRGRRVTNQGAKRNFRGIHESNRNNAADLY